MTKRRRRSNVVPTAGATRPSRGLTKIIAVSWALVAVLTASAWCATAATAAGSPSVSFTSATYSGGTVTADFRGKGFQTRPEGADVAVFYNTCDGGVCQQLGTPDSAGNFTVSVKFPGNTCSGTAPWQAASPDGATSYGGGNVKWDNCPPPVQKPTVKLSEDKSTITVGDSVKLSWTSNDATSLTASGAWNGSKQVPSGNQTVTPSAAGTFTYTLTTGTNTAGSGTDSVTLVVKPKVSPTGTGTTSTGAGGTAGAGSGSASAQPSLANTGDPTLPIAAVGLGLLALGAICLLFARRRTYRSVRHAR